MWFFRKNKKDKTDGIVNYNTNREKTQKKFLCHAPFKSLYFRTDGSVTPCCYNPWYVLGKYPQQTLEDIWQGQKMEEIRNGMKQFNFAPGCDVCKQDFIAQKFSEVKALQYDGLPAAKPYPLVLEFEIDNTCNLACIMCDELHSSKIQQKKSSFKPHPSVYDEQFLKQLQPWLKNIVDARFNGGEPFLSKLYLQLWKNIISVNSRCTISVQTNGTVLYDNIKAILNKGLFNISVSLDALDKGIYEKIRPHADYEKLMENIEFFINYCQQKNTHYSIAVCPMRLNWKELPGLVHFANENAAKLYFHTLWYPPHLALWNLSSSQLVHIHAYLNRFKWTARSETEKNNINVYRSLVANIEGWRLNALEHEKLTATVKESKILKDLLIAKIKNWCDSNTKKYAENNKEKFKQIIENISKEFSEEQLFKSYNEILKTPVDFVVNTLNQNDETLIKEKFEAFIF